MTLLAAYDRARAALASAMAATTVEQALASRAELEHVRLYARQLEDRLLLADATEFQLRAERQLGELLIRAKQAGELYVDRRRRKAADGGAQPATLAEIGVDKKLSMTAQKAAALRQEAFEHVVSAARHKVQRRDERIVTKTKVAGASTAAGFEPFEVRLLDGTSAGSVRLGKIPALIVELEFELRLLRLIRSHVGRSFDTLATVEESISQSKLSEMIADARERRS